MNKYNLTQAQRKSITLLLENQVEPFEIRSQLGIPKKAIFGSREYKQHLAKQNGFNSIQEYQHDLANRNRFSTFLEYKQHLAKQNGFRSIHEYNTHLAKQNGFRSIHEYRQYLVKRKGFGGIANKIANHVLNNEPSSLAGILANEDISKGLTHDDLVKIVSERKWFIYNSKEDILNIDKKLFYGD